jgi:hypothetical protein
MPRNAAAFLLQFVERVRRALMDEGAIDVQQQFAAVLRDHMTLPDLVDEGLRRGRR